MSTDGSRRLRIGLGLATIAFAVLVSVANAHGIGESSADRTTLEFVPLGIEHMLLGWDHLAFIAGILLLATGFREAAKLISLFVLGHSITLIAATLAGWQLSATAVDVVIALSLVYVGVQGMSGKKTDFRIVGAIIFGFGLVHGLGLSTRLQDLGIPDDGLLLKTIAFNVGVEIGQLWALLVFFGIGALFVRFVSGPDRERLVRVGFATILAGGAIGAAVLSAPGNESAETEGTVAGCTSDTTEVAAPDPRAGHPERLFYEPGEEVPTADLEHVVGDGYVIVRYSEDLSDVELSSLRETVAGSGQYMIAAPDPEQTEAFRALTAETTLSCEEYDASTLEEFSNDWLEQALG